MDLNMTQALLIAFALVLVVLLFTLDLADRRRNQRVIEMMEQFLTNPEVRRLATGVSDDTPVGLTFTAEEPEPEPEPQHVWIAYFESRQEMTEGSEWPFYIIDKWERNELGETRFVESNTALVPKPVDPELSVVPTTGLHPQE